MNRAEQDAAMPCIRSGFCCKQATCSLGLARGAPSRGCTFLMGDKPGDYSCQLINEDPELGTSIAIGGGCSSTLFNPDRQALGAPISQFEKMMRQIENRR